MNTCKSLIDVVEVPWAPRLTAANGIWSIGLGTDTLEHSVMKYKRDTNSIIRLVRQSRYTDAHTHEGRFQKRLEQPSNFM